MHLACGAFTLDLSEPRVMGVLNVTPDSFSDGGLWLEPSAALDQARRMQEEGAAIIDVGGESTRPGADAVPPDTEYARVIPVIERLASELSVPVSVDTSKPHIMRAAVAAGASLINDVLALQAPGALEAAAACEAAVCLMHMQGEPRTMQKSPHYDDVVAEVCRFLDTRVAACERAGIDRRRLAIDPGFGFGKTLGHNLTLLGRLREVARETRPPVLVGLSRKSMFGALLERGVTERVPGSVAAAALSVWNGARIVRAHDVAATVDAVRVASAVHTTTNDGATA